MRSTLALLLLLAAPATAQDWPPYCGTGGCAVDTLVDGIRSSFLFHAWGTETENGTTYLTAPNDSGGTARFLWGNGEWQIQ